MGKAPANPLLSSSVDPVVSPGPGGLAALKTLREEGFNAVAFERRDHVGGLWSFSPDPAYTSVIDETVCNSSKFIVRDATFARNQSAWDSADD